MTQEPRGTRERARWFAAPVLLAALVFLKPFTRELIGVFEDPPDFKLENTYRRIR